MKKTLAAAAIWASLIGMTVAANAATDIFNACTSTYEMVGWAVQASGSDTVTVRSQGLPSLTVVKYAKNMRSGIEMETVTVAISADTIEFRITCTNSGEALAETITLTDYVPTVGLTYVAGSETFTAAANCANPSISKVGDKITFTCNNAAGTDPGAAANIEIRFRMVVQ